MRKKSTKATQAIETDSHTNLGNRQVRENQQMLGFLNLRSQAILVRSFAKDGLE